LPPAGYGAGNWVRGSSPLPYRINFENLGPGSKDGNGNSYPTFATAPAQRVTIVDQLSPYFDWTSFRMAEIAFGDFVVPVPGNASHYAGSVPVFTAGGNFVVEIEAGIDFNTGRVTMAMQAIDPETGLPPDVSLGVLPPEDGTGRGMGHLSFVIRPKAGLPNGTAIRNVAEIRFDTNAVIATNQIDPQDASRGTDPAKEALVTLDGGAPTAAIAPLPAASDKIQFEVEWSGDDQGGVGIRSYDIFVSVDGAPFALWLDGTTASSAIYEAGYGQHLAFFAIAEDFLGQRSEIPELAHARTVTAADAYLVWLRSRFGDSVDDPEQENILWGDDADPDGDGVSNLFEFISGTHPGVADGQLGYSVRFEDQRAILTYRLTTVSPHSLDHRIEWSTDLVQWQSAGVVHRLVQSTPEFQQFEAEIETSDLDKAFFRRVVNRRIPEASSGTNGH
jgi:hypothetical protein